MRFVRESLASWAVLFLYGLSLVLLAWFHVVGQDEAQAWNIAMASRYPWDVLVHGEFEGHTPLWHLILWLFSRFPIDLVSYFTAAFCCVFAFCLLRDRPFPLWVCVVLLFGYFTFYDYPTIPRPYVLAMVCSALFASALYQRRYNLIYLSCLLSIIAFSSAYGILLSAPLGILALITLWKDQDGLRVSVPLVVGFSIYTVSLLSSAYFIVAPLEGNEFAQKVVTGGRSDRVLLTQAALSSVFPQYRQLPLGIGSVLRDSALGFVLLNATLAIVLLSATAVLIQRKAGLIAWLVALVVISLGASFAGTGTTRHLGHLYIAAITIFWVASRDVKGVKARGSRLTGVPSFVLIAVLLYHFALGVMGAAYSVKAPHTSGKKIAAFIEQNIEPPYRFITNNTHDFGHVMAYLDIPVYDTVCDCWQRRADMAKSRYWEPDALYRQWCRLYRDEGVEFALIASREDFPEPSRYDLIARFP